MKYLNVKLRRDMMHLWSQFFSVFMMALLAMIIYSGMEGVWNGLDNTAEQYFKDTNLCDAWIKSSGITEEEAEQLNEIPHVRKATISMTTTLDIVIDEDTTPDIKITTLSDESCMKPLLLSGEKYDVESKGIWIDESFANEREIQVGDNITVAFMNQERELEVKGIILDSEYIYYTGSATETIPNAAMHGYAIISEKQAEELFGMIIYNEARIKVDGDCDYDKLKDNAKEIIGEEFYTLLARDDLASVSQISKETKQMKNMAQLFSAVFILLALLTMYTTMSRLVKNQVVQIGTFKALGLKDWQIRVHYALYGLIVSLFGGLIGSFIGRNTVSKAVMNIKKTSLTLPEWNIQVSYVSYVLIGCISLVCIVSALLAANASLKGMPAQVMRVQNQKKDKRKAKQVKENSWISYEWRWVLRDNSRNKVRYIMGVVGVAGSMMLMMAGFGIRNSIDFSNDYVYQKQYVYDFKAVFNNDAKENMEVVENTINKYQMLQENSVKVESDDTSLNLVLSVIDTGDYINLETAEGENYNLPDEGMVISRLAANKLGVNKGDTITYNVVGSSDFITAEIQEIILSPTPQGIYFSRSAWEKEGNEFLATSVLINENEYEDIKDLDCFKEITSKDTQIKNMDKLSETVKTIIVLLIAASILLSVVILYNLGMLNFVERYREYATMKVLGFYIKEIKTLILRDCIITTIPGWIIGIPIGYKFLKAYMGIVSFTAYEWISTLTISKVVLVSVLVVGCSFCVSLFICHKVRKIIMVEALKSVD